LCDTLQGSAVSLDRGAGDCVDHWVDLIALPQRVESREGQAGLGPQSAEDEFASFTVLTMFSSSRDGSIDRTDENWVGW
jgi:hypothetical protein